MKHYLLTFAILLILSGCATQERCNDRFPPTTTEVTKTVTVYRDTTVYVYIKGDTIRGTKTVYIDRGGLIQSDISFLSSRFAYSKAYVKDSKLFHDLIQLDDSIASVIHNATRTELQYVDKTTEVPVPRALKWYEKVLFWAGGLMFTSVVMMVLFIAARFFLKI